MSKEKPVEKDQVVREPADPPAPDQGPPDGAGPPDESGEGEPPEGGEPVFDPDPPSQEEKESIKEKRDDEALARSPLEPDDPALNPVPPSQAGPVEVLPEPEEQPDKAERRAGKCRHEELELTVSVPGLIHRVSRRFKPSARGPKRSELLDEAIDELIEISR